LTTERDPGSDSYGGAFYMAQHGIRIAGAENTIVAWRHKLYHGTSLQDVDPLDENPPFSQRGLAIITSSQLLKTYVDWKAGQITTQKARSEIDKEGDDLDVIY
jgi:hypothetical protein